MVTREYKALLGLRALDPVDINLASHDDVRLCRARALSVCRESR